MIFLLSFSFRVKSRSSWKAKKLTDIQFCEKKRLSKSQPKLLGNVTSPWINNNFVLAFQIFGSNMAPNYQESLNSRCTL